MQIKTLVDLPNCDNVKSALIFGNSVIVGNDTKIGDIGLFFPVETALDGVFLMKNNLYRDSILNSDPEKKGYFETHGRIKCVKFRGHKSEGFFVPISFLDYLGDYLGHVNELLVVGDEFDKFLGHEICHKYVPKMNMASTFPKGNKRQPKPSDNIIEGQFRFHIDTANLRRNIDRISLGDIISITDKWHGTSAIFANVLVKRELTLLEKITKWFGCKIQETHYDLVHASRRVVKGVGEKEKDGIHFYGTNLWGVVAKEVADRIPKGYTIYCEIVGYTPEGKAIQKGYVYDCEVGSHKTLVYRITITNEDGKVLELDYNQRIAFCAKYGFETVKHLFHGYAYEFGKWSNEYGNEDDFRTEFLQLLEQDYMSRSCEYNLGKPSEGIVVRRESLLDECESLKLKSFDFLTSESKDLDAGILDMESQEDFSVDDGTEII